MHASKGCHLWPPMMSVAKCFVKIPQYVLHCVSHTACLIMYLKINYYTGGHLGILVVVVELWAFSLRRSTCVGTGKNKRTV